MISGGSEMKTYNAADYGIQPGNEVGKELNSLLRKMRKQGGEKRIVFPDGIYFINAETCPVEKLYITNTIPEREYKPGEEKHMQAVAFDIRDTCNLTLSGTGATFVTRGKLTNAIIVNSRNITFEGMEITAENPDEHELTVEKVGDGYADFRLDSSSKYIKRNGRFYFVGHDYETSFLFNVRRGWYFGKISGGNTDRIVRSPHPFRGYRSISELGPGLFRVKFDSAEHINKGDRYCLYDCRRTHVGIFMEGSENIVLKDIRQRHNVSLALVAQNTENITVEGVDFIPDGDGDKMFASYADFMQFCMCRGKVSVTGSRFIGAGDDVMNVHGTHLMVKSVRGKTLSLRFMHPDSYGYLPFNEGDFIEFINPDTLIPQGRAKVVSARLISKHTVELKIDDASAAEKGLAVENVSLCPEVYFADNYMSRVVTRGLLITTRGKVLIENNHFNNMIMPSVLCSDDARTWYESGLCTDVTVRGNTFSGGDFPYIQVLPENSPYTNPVHGKITIENNIFEGNNGVDIQRCERLIFRGNKTPVPAKEYVVLTDVVKANFR